MVDRGPAVFVTLVLGLAPALGACDDDPPPPLVLPSAAASDVPSAMASVRERTRVYYVVHKGDDRCFVFWEDKGKQSVDKEVRCPREIEEGERLRLAGRTCFRESKDPARVMPARCPKQIFYAERDDKLGGGPFKLRSKDR